MSNFDSEYRKNGARALHAIFSSSTLGRQALEFLENEFIITILSSENPSENAIYRLGQCSVIAEIKDMINKIERGEYGNE